MFIESVMPSNHLILCHPLLFPLSIIANIRSFLMSWLFASGVQSISPSNEYSRLISFRIDWFDLLVVQGTLKSILQHHSSKTSILWYSSFLMVQLSHPYMTIGKTIVLTRWTSVGKVMSLLFNMLSRLVIVFLPRSKCLLISQLRSPPTGILEPKKIKSLSQFLLFLHLFAMKWWDRMPWSSFLEYFKPALSLSSFTFIKRLFSYSSLSTIRVVSSAYLRVLIFLLAILIPACNSSSLAFCMMYSSLVAQMVKNPPAMHKTWVWYLGQEEPL